MRRAVFVLLISVMLALLPGCKDRVNLEDITLALMVGLDLDEDNNIVVYASSPVFSKEAKEPNEVTKVTAKTLRESRGMLEGRVSALLSIGKLQNVLIGKRLLLQPDWSKILDVYYRDSKTRTNARLIAVDGSMEEIMFFAPPDKRRLSLHIAKLIDTADKRNWVSKTTLFDFHRQLYEKGKTPYLPMLRKTVREVVSDKTALLTDEGKYVGSINLQENELLRLLQDQKKADLSLTYRLPEERKNPSFFGSGWISYYVLDVDRKVRTSYANGKFRFDIEFKLPIRLTELWFAFDAEKNAKKLEHEIDEQMNTQMKSLIKKIQAYRLDPIGLGVHARAFQYGQWKKVQDKWGETFAEAEVNVRVHTNITDVGETK